MTMNPELIGMIAAVMTTSGYVPQALKVVREKNTRSISLSMYCIMTLGGLTWFAYGLMIGSMPIVLANGVTSLLTAIILVMKIKHG